jgi:hypothetical protein
MGAAVISHDNAAPVLEPAEHVLDAVSLAIQDPVMRNVLLAARRDGMQGSMPRAVRAWRKRLLS